jgi:PAS domain S-box-containing protein
MMAVFDPGPGTAGPGAAEQPGLALRELVDAAPVGVALLDTELRYTSVNPALAAMDGRSPDDHIGRSFGELLPELVDAVEPALRRALSTGQPIVNRELTTEGRSGSAARGHWLGSVHPLRDDQGDVVALGLVVVDVTARTRAERDLRASERRFRAVVEAMDDLVFTLDADGRYTGVFGRWFERHGFAPESLVGRTPREVLGHLRSAVHEGAARRALLGEHVVYEWSLELGG